MPDNKTSDSADDNRAERYRRFAAESRKLADETEADEIRATFLSLSQCWTSLADKADHESERERS